MASLQPSDPLIGIVGPCGAGKSTLIEGLRALGFRCRHIAQEHSYVPNMWQRISHPDLLIFVQASFAACTARRRLNWSEADYLEQLRRLEHARRHAHLTIETDALSIEQVREQAAAFLRRSWQP
jgi:deoxyadenosine/deoxycytidine kinase